MDSTRLEPSQIPEIAREFQEATNVFYLWLENLHRSLVCGTEHPLSESEHRARTAFSEWRALAEANGLLGFSELSGLTERFGGVATTAQQLADARLSGAPILQDQYDEYLKEQGRFVAQLSALRQVLVGSAQRTDPLTSLEQRAPFLMLVEKTHEAAVRGGSPYAVAIVGIDGFDKLACELDRNALDAVVKQLADTLLLELRRADTVCRYGGSRFGMLLAATEFSPAVDVCERIRTTIDNASALLASETPGATVSIGIANWSRHAASMECIRRAESALASAEAAGHNRVFTWEPAAT